ncbi:MAG: SPOR domain-containing protein [Alphaproteobacteria bacterium]|nr:SPOR domain-containing protein [Alphaproteobacteria bacterium]
MAYNLEEVDPGEGGELYADRREDDVPRSGRLLRIVGALVVMGLFAGGLWFAYHLGTRHAGDITGTSDVPLIRADNRPIKVKPDNPGGMQVPDRDMLIYGEQRPQVEHLLPPPEQPMPRPVPPPISSKVQTATPAASVLSAPSAPTPTTTAPASAAPALTPAPTATDPIAERIGQLAAVPRTSPAKPPPGVALEKKGLRLQLGAVRTESEARGEWERLKRKNTDLLGTLSAVAVRADLGEKGIYYRIQAGPISDPSTADRICSELRQRHLGCMIVR